MISYRGVRYIAAYTTGILSFILFACVSWTCTEWYIELVFLWSLFGALLVGAIMWLLTEPKKKRKPEQQKKDWTPDCVPFVTFRREEGRK